MPAAFDIARQQVEMGTEEGENDGHSERIATYREGQWYLTSSAAITLYRTAYLSLRELEVFEAMRLAP